MSRFKVGHTVRLLDDCLLFNGCKKGMRFRVLGIEKNCFEKDKFVLKCQKERKGTPCGEIVSFDEDDVQIERSVKNG